MYLQGTVLLGDVPFALLTHATYAETAHSGIRSHGRLVRDIACMGVYLGVYIKTYLPITNTGATDSHLFV